MSEILSQEDVAHVAHLARLAVTEAEVETYQKQLSAILAYVDILSSVDTADVEPVGQVSGLVNVLALDAPGADSVDRAEFLAGAPASQSPYVEVKAVLKTQD